MSPGLGYRRIHQASGLPCLAAGLYSAELQRWDWGDLGQCGNSQALAGFLQDPLLIVSI